MIILLGSSPVHERKKVTRTLVDACVSFFVLVFLSLHLIPTPSPLFPPPASPNCADNLKYNPPFSPPPPPPSITMLRVFGYNSFLPLQDGTCIIHTARKGEYVVTLRPTGMSPGAQDSFCHVTGLALSEYGNIVVCYQQENSRSLCRYSINGKLLTKDVKLKEDVARVFISGEFVVIGGADGKLEIRKLQGYENLIMYIVTVCFAIICFCILLFSVLV